MKRKALEELEFPFADPTYDYTFKMIFNENHLDLLRDFLNAMWEFKGKELIEEVSILDPLLNKDDSYAVSSTVDVRCRTREGKEIAVEMQRFYKDYFLPRTQSYMAQMIASQVKVGESSQYHTKMKATYVLVIAKEDLFVKEYEFKNTSPIDDHAFEKTVIPYVKELREEFPGNKIYKKFFELPRFERYEARLSSEELNSDKIQWLKFFVGCDKIKEVPLGVNHSIQKAYEIMDMRQWDADQREAIWARQSLIEAEAEERKREAEEHEREVKKLKEEKKEAELKGEVKIMINFIKKGMDLENLQKFLSEEFNLTQISNIYDQVKANPDCNADNIVEMLGQSDVVKEKGIDKLDA